MSFSYQIHLPVLSFEKTAHNAYGNIITPIMNNKIYIGPASNNNGSFIVQTTHEITPKQR